MTAPTIEEIDRCIETLERSEQRWAANAPYRRFLEAELFCLREVKARLVGVAQCAPDQEALQAAWAEGYEFGLNSRDKTPGAAALRALVIEECAKVCEDLRHDDYSAETSDWSGGTFDCARAIRALALSEGNVAQDAPEADIDKLRSVFEAAYGLCHGYDWNNGTAAKACGYRRKLLSAVNAIRPVPDFEGKYASPMTEGDRATDEDWRDDPAADERWQAGCDFALVQLCHAIDVDPKSVRWDAATETLDGDVNAVIWNILRAKMGEDWDPHALPSTERQ